MALDTFIAGRYANTYNAVDVGILEEGVELQLDTKEELIDKSDLYGDAILDLIYRGLDAYLQFESKAYKAGSITPFTPWVAIGLLVTTAVPVGVLGSDKALATVLTAAANSPAAASPASLTASKSILAPNYSTRLQFNSRLRRVPTRLILLPYDASGGNIRHFTTT